MAEETDIQTPQREAVAPASAGYPLPCPHCGGPAELKRYHADRRRVFFGCADPWCNFTYNEASEALIAWNRRTADNREPIMKDNDAKFTKANPDLEGFDLEALEGLGAFYDGSGGGIKQLAWEMEKLRELRERMALLESFVRKYVLILARLSWSSDAEVIHPTKKQGEDKDISVFVPTVELVSYTYDKKSVKPSDIAALWPQAQWRRSMPRWGDSETERDYTADVDGVLIRIRNAEQLPPQKPVDRFGPCGPVRFAKVK